MVVAQAKVSEGPLIYRPEQAGYASSWDENTTPENYQQALADFILGYVVSPHASTAELRVFVVDGIPIDLRVHQACPLSPGDDIQLVAPDGTNLRQQGIDQINEGIGISPDSCFKANHPLEKSPRVNGSSAKVYCRYAGTCCAGVLARKVLALQTKPVDIKP